MSHSETHVNFYVLPDSDLEQRLHFVFRLIEKAFDQQLLTLVVCADNTQLTALDRLIWEEKPERFIPHDILDGATGKSPAPILLTEHIENISGRDQIPAVVIDLSYDATPLAFPKIMLVANQHVDILPNARLKYQAYVNQGIKPKVHKL